MCWKFVICWSYCFLESTYSLPPPFQVFFTFLLSLALTIVLYVFLLLNHLNICPDSALNLELSYWFQYYSISYSWGLWPQGHPITHPHCSHTDKSQLYSGGWYLTGSKPLENQYSVTLVLTQRGNAEPDQRLFYSNILSFSCHCLRVWISVFHLCHNVTECIWSVFAEKIIYIYIWKTKLSLWKRRQSPLIKQDSSIIYLHRIKEWGGIHWLGYLSTEYVL